MTLAIGMVFNMQIYLLRHAQSKANNLNFVCGTLDYALSETGEHQALQISKKLSGINFSKIYSSPLSRAIKTIKTIKTYVPITICQDFSECDNGYVSLLTLDALWEKDSRFEKPWLHPDLRYPGGESFLDMTTRIKACFERLKVDWKSSDTVLIAGHHGTVKTLYMHIMGLGLQNYPDFELGNCDYIYFEVLNDEIIKTSHVPFANSLAKDGGCF